MASRRCPQYGTAVATSVTGGAPVSVRITRLRLYPIDLEATLTIDGLDLAMGRVYLPAEHAGAARPGPWEHIGACDAWTPPMACASMRRRKSRTSS